MIIGSIPATNAAGMAAARSDITVETKQHHDDGERLRVRIARLEQCDDEIGPGRAAKRGGQHELASPRAGGLFLFAAVEKRDRQRIADRDRAGDEGDPGQQRTGVDPRQRGRADAERDDAEHRRGAAVDLGEQPHHRRRMARDRIGLGERPPRLPELDGHLAPARGRVGVASVPAPRQIGPDVTHNRPTRTPYSRQSCRPKCLTSN